MAPRSEAGACASRPLLLVCAGFTGLCIWTYWPTLADLVRAWSSDPQYSHGYLVPLFALLLLRLRWKDHGPAQLQSSWWGLPFLVIAALLRLAAANLNLDWFDGLSLLICCAGLFTLVGGLPALRWAWPAVAFLFFMVPLPYRLAHGLAGPLQSLATQLSAYVMQTLGMPALREGNIIVLNENRIAVVEACSGLSMLFIFIALSTAMALLLRRPLLDRAIILFSAIPVAILANLMRITTTGIVIELVGKRAADLVFHDLAGWLMMPFALCVLWLELKLLDYLFYAPGDEGDASVPQGARVLAPVSTSLAEKTGTSGPRIPAALK